MTMPRATPHPERTRSRHMLGGLSLLVLATLVIANSGAAVDPLLTGVDHHASTERRQVRTVSTVQARATRGVSRADERPAAAATRTPSAPPSRDHQVQAPPANPDLAGPTLLVHIALLNLPPPVC